MGDVSGGKVLLAAPRGYCAGVERAVDAVERALAKHGAPVYVRKQIVHNLHVVRDLESKGAVFVEEETEVPEGAVVVLSAHGVAPEVYANSRVRGLEVIDATCPLVTKVHVEARRFAAAGDTIVLIGHAGHEEVVGTTGQAPERTILVQSPEEARTVEVPDPENLSLPHPDHPVRRRDERDPRDPPRAVPRDPGPAARGHLLRDPEPAGRGQGDRPRVDVVLVIGSTNSSNSNRLAEVARELGTPGYLVDDESEVDPAWLRGRRDGRPHVGRLGAGVAGGSDARRGWRHRGSTTWRSSRSPRSACASRCRPASVRSRWAGPRVRSLAPGAELVAVLVGLLVGDRHERLRRDDPRQRVDVLEDDAARHLPRLGDADQQVALAAEDRDAGDVGHLRDPLDQTGGRAGLGAHVHVACARR